MKPGRFARSVATLGQLRIRARELGIGRLSTLRRRDLVQRIVEAERAGHAAGLDAIKGGARATA